MSDRAKRMVSGVVTLAVIATCLLTATRDIWGENYKHLDRLMTDEYYQKLLKNITQLKEKITAFEAQLKQPGISKKEKNDATKGLAESRKALEKWETIKTLLDKYKAVGKNLTKEEFKILEEASGADRSRELAETKALVTGKDGAADFTKGLGPEMWASRLNLGPIGVSACVSKEMPRHQFLVDWVFEGSPAHGKPAPVRKAPVPKDPTKEPARIPPIQAVDGLLLKQDVILGIISPKVDGLAEDGNFTDECNRVLARAIAEAEKAENGGKIVLKVWRPKTRIVYDKESKRHQYIPPEGIPEVEIVQPLEVKVIQVAVTIPVLGTYSQTSPWNCEKTDKLIELAARDIVNSKDLKEFGSGFGVYAAGLGLLATGEEKYMPKVRELALEQVNKEMAKATDAEILAQGGMKTWGAAYSLVFLSEYYLATKDKEVLPAIRSRALRLAAGVSGVGTWGHGGVGFDNMYSHLGGYGAMNQATLVAAIGLVLAQKCGIDHPYVNKAVELCLSFYPHFVDKGVIPYGDHYAKRDKKHDSNGKNSIAAVLFDLVGRKREADYFTRMTLMSHQEREGGHTGHYFAWLWGDLGAARGGPEAAAMFCRNTHYWTDLERRWDGTSFYQPILGEDPGKYRGWSTTGCRLLEYCLPRKKLYITGKGGSVVPPIVGDDLKMLEEAGFMAGSGDSESEAADAGTEGNVDSNPGSGHLAKMGKLSNEQLLGFLSHYSPLIRERAAEIMGRRGMDVVDRCLEMLKGDHRYARYGACQALRFDGKNSEKAFDPLVTIIEKDEDWTLRYYATYAMIQPLVTSKYRDNCLNLPPVSYANRLLKVISNPELKCDQDKRRLQQELTKVVFGEYGTAGKGGILKDKECVAQVDRKTLTAAILECLQNPNPSPRCGAVSMLQFFSKEDLEPLWGPLYYSLTKNKETSGGDASPAALQAVELMAKYRIKEGFSIASNIVENSEAHYLLAIVAKATVYGSLWQPYIAKLEAKSHRNASIKNFLEQMKDVKGVPELISIDKEVKEYEANPPVAKLGQEQLRLSVAKEVKEYESKRAAEKKE